MSKSNTKPAGEVILSLKAHVNDLTTKLNEKNSNDMEFQERLHDFAERTRMLRESLADADTAYTLEQQRAADLEAELRLERSNATVISAQYFTDIKSIRDAAEKQKVWNILFGVVAGFVAAWLVL